MLTTLISAVVGFVVATGLFQSVYVALYCRFLRQSESALRDPALRDPALRDPALRDPALRDPALRDPEQRNRQQQLANIGAEAGAENASEPEVSVVLCLRGVDPSLDQCLTAILDQDKSNFRLHLVFDHKEDPAVRFAEQFFQKNRIGQSTHETNPVATKPVEFHFVDHAKFSAGSLKCHALVTAVEASAGESEIIALIDADSVVDRRWLSDLVAPLSDPAVAATTGNRWFEPDDSRTGSLVRKIWNAAAIVQMYLYNIAWGGSLAIRSDTLRESGLLDRWKSAFCEDTMITSHLKSRGAGRVVRVGQLVVANPESTTLAGAFRWITRQLLTARLYHPRWPLVLMHAVSVGICLLAVPALLVANLIGGTWPASAILLLVFLGFQILNAVLIFFISSGNRRILALRRSNSVTQLESAQSGTLSETLQPAQSRGSRSLKYLGAMLLTQLTQPSAAAIAAIARRASWRGIEYEIGPEIRMTKYRKYTQPSQDVLAETAKAETAETGRSDGGDSLH